jgi:hypothetical protein
MTPVYPKGRFQYCGNITDKTTTHVELSGVGVAFVVAGAVVVAIASIPHLFQQLVTLLL